jgi:hypothetical protein
VSASGTDQSRFAREAILKLVRTSREAQGLPPTISDPGALSRLAVLVSTAKSAQR